MSDIMSVLIVDDNKIFLEIIKFYFENYFPKFSLIITSDINEALEYIKVLKFDLLITDYMMPKITGLELSKMIREIDKDIKIIICSAYYSEFFQREEEKKYFDIIMTKPIDIETFKKIITSAVNSRYL